MGTFTLTISLTQGESIGRAAFHVSDDRHGEAVELDDSHDLNACELPGDPGSLLATAVPPSNGADHFGEANAAEHRS